MNLLKEPVAASGDNLDNLLRAFFQAEMPNPWPAVEVPSPGVVVLPDREEESAFSSGFQAETANPWPGVGVSSPGVVVLPDREEEPTSRSGQGSLAPSRLALAASIALLVSGPLFLAGVLRDTHTSNSVPPGSAPTAYHEPLPGSSGKTASEKQVPGEPFFELDAQGVLRIRVDSKEGSSPK